jgi:hypothetical protein
MYSTGINAPFWETGVKTQGYDSIPSSAEERQDLVWKTEVLPHMAATTEADQPA